MKTVTKLALSLVTALFLTSCGGGGDILDDSGYDNSGYDNGGYDNGGYDNGGYDNGGYDNGGYDNGGSSNTPDGSSLSVDNLAGYSIVSTYGSQIDFCSDGSLYYYANGNGNHDGYYTTVYGTKIDFYDNVDNGSYAIETGNGYLEEGYTYSVKGVESFTIASIGYAGC